MATTMASAAPTTEQRPYTAAMNVEEAPLPTGEGTTPMKYDVMCSKDKTHSTHPGNRLFRERIDAMKEIYRSTKNKQEKMRITKEIVKFLQDNYSSRFLKRDGNGQWAPISDQAARDKVSHALRFATRREKKRTHSHVNAATGFSRWNEKRIAANERETAHNVSPEPPRPPHPEPIAKENVVTEPTHPALAGRTVPEEHLEHSKWLLALRQGT